MTGLAAALAEVLAELLGRGFELPIYAGVVSANGCAMWLVYVANDRGGLDVKTLAEGLPHKNMMLPINIMLVDSRGEAAPVVVPPGEPSALHMLN